MNVFQRYQKPKILLTGATGQVGSKLFFLLHKVSNVWAPNRIDFDLNYPEGLRQKIRKFQPQLIINPAAYTSVDEAENNKNQCFSINQFSPKVLAEEAEKLNIPIIHFSTNYVFDGKKQGAYLETDPTNPINVYGLSKLGGEKAIQSTTDKHLILRTAWVYDKENGENFYRKIDKLLKKKDEISVVNDEIGNPTSASFLANSVYAILTQLDTFNEAESRWGLYHLIEDVGMSRYQFAQKILNEIAAVNDEVNCKINATSEKNYKIKTKRPQNTVLSTKKINYFFSIPGKNDQ